MNGQNAAKPGRTPGSPAMDMLDRRILACYQQDTRQSAAQIGAEVGLSAAAVQRRLKAMREQKIIVRETAIVDTGAAGFPVTCVVGVDLEKEGNQYIRDFKRAMRNHPCVQQCYYVTGEYDFILTVVAPSLADYETFTQDAIMSNENVARFTTWVVMDAVKVGCSLPWSSASALPR
ncbi:Lrp/AsnC family transcriptional regulator [Affinibrenneria salicis]|uniref:Lrp/AsnC family transcriptional regulator n=2 Tax=Affinibrenneria salicis TaxID=2590031 RepID=A0A5J5FUP8_9GAMM|nr:Lrp/AsnC family transcriptional regulator [Affinibrenneria salicis]